MKIWKKINKGFLLTLIVLLALIIYLVGVEEQRKEDKTNIQKATEEFTEFTDKYTVLPEEMQTLTEKISKEKVEKYETEMKTKLEDLMISNEEAVKIQNQILVSNLENGYSQGEIKSKQERKITKITSYEFDGDQVTVTFNSKLETNTKYLNEENEEQERKKSLDIIGEEVVLQKVDGEWKIVYSNLRYEDYGNYYEDTMVDY